MFSSATLPVELLDLGAGRDLERAEHRLEAALEHRLGAPSAPLPRAARTSSARFASGLLQELGLEALDLALRALLDPCGRLSAVLLDAAVLLVEGLERGLHAVDARPG